MGKKALFLAAFALLAGAALFFALRSREGERAARPGFVSTNGTNFIVDGRPFRFTGANVAVMYTEEERAHMPETLKEAARDGVSVVRVWAFGEGDENGVGQAEGGARRHNFRSAPGHWNEEAFVHLDRVLALAARNNLRVQLCLTNWWRDTGGVTQYLDWAGIKDAADDSQPYGINAGRAMLFYTNEVTRRLYREHVQRVVTRRNTVTGILYRDDPTIMGYELMNEAQAVTGRWAERRAWVVEMSAYLKTLDPDHLVTPGTWGYRTAWERREWLAEHNIKTIDYCDVHHYPSDDLDSFVDSPAALQAFLENRAAAALSINKPLVIGEFGMGHEGYKGFSEVEWYRAFFESAARSGVGGAMFWIFTPDSERNYGITYTIARDESVRAEIRKASALFASLQDAKPPAHLLDSSRHLVPHQFAFARAIDGPAALPEVLNDGKDGGPIIYSFRPEGAASARFEKLGDGPGYVWGSGVGYFEYIIPEREQGRMIRSVTVRAHLQPVLPQDAPSNVNATRVTLLINGVDCGSRLVAVEDTQRAVTQEWVVDSLAVRTQASQGLPLSIRFEVKVDADQPLGLNISGFPEGHDPPDARPIEVQLR
ncbi:MAG TPA: cellulase family glycosylhydrolase [Pyrinomonadaceae bacterium]